jgi:hypothetical protein
MQEIHLQMFKGNRDREESEVKDVAGLLAKCFYELRAHRSQMPSKGIHLTVSKVCLENGRQWSRS